MIVDNNNIVRSLFFPPETDSELIIDADTPLPATIPKKQFQSVTGRNLQLFKTLYRIQLIKLSGSYTPERGRQSLSGRFCVVTIKNILCPNCKKVMNHEDIIAWMSCYFKTANSKILIPISV